MTRALTRAFLLLALPAHLTAAKDFPAPPDTQETDLKLPAAAESLAGLTLPEGFRATVFATEPEARQPIAMAFDDRGRLWVAECYTYADRKVNFDLGLRDRIVIFEDADGDGRFDGRFDKRTVFHDGLQRLTSLALGFGGVWVTAAPNLLFIPDANRDDKPDGEPVVLLDGWNAGKARHNVVNGLKWGPDGWLYGRHGILDVSKVGKPGTPEDERAPLRCCIWRYHPTRKTFELVTEGTTNSWGHDWDQHGQLFFINTVIGHLWHAVPGAYFKRMYGQHFNPHLYELIEQTADHFHWDTGFKWSKARKLEGSTHAKGGGHAHCGLMIYQGDDWPDRYRHKLFTVNLLGRRVNCDRIERSGAGYLGKHEPDFLSVRDVWFRGIELDYSFDGSVYLLDWSDVGECHENDGVHRSSGRIFRITWGVTTHKPFDLAALPAETLAKLQLEKNERYVRHARRLLQERAHAGEDLSAAKKILAAVFNDNPDVTRKLRALWSLHAIGATGSDSPFAPLRLLAHEEEHVRVWAVRLLADDGAAPTPEACDALAKLAAKEKSGLVLLYLASALRRLPHDKRWPLAAALAQADDLAEDPAFPLLVWYGIEPAVSANPTAALKLAATSKLPKLRQFIPRRLTEQRK